jgi:hypothetical protein
MKKTIIAALAAVCLLAASCGREEDPFAGTDNYIASFALTQGETVLNASIADGVITVTAPENFTLDGATATVELSENARIIPNPADITEWDDETLFSVTSHNGKTVLYKYTVARSSIDAEGSVLLETQADVDAFGQRGVTLIEGNLIIGRNSGTDSIRTLAPLAALKEVGYSLIIHPTYAGEDLAGLERLEAVGDEIRFAGQTNLRNVTLPKLKTAGSIAVGTNRAMFISEVDLPVLTRVDRALSLQSLPLDELSLPSLKTVGGSLVVTTLNNQTGTLDRIALPSLESTGGFSLSYFVNVGILYLPELKECYGNFNLNMMNGLRVMGAPKLEVCTGTIASTSPVAEVRFPALVEGGTITIQSQHVTAIDFASLERANAITVNSQKIDALDLPKLKTVGGALTIALAPATLRTLSLPALESVGGAFTLGTGYGDRSLESVQFPKLTTVGGKLHIRGFATAAAQRENTQLKNLDGFAALKNAASIEVGYQTALTSFEGLREVFKSLPDTGWKVTGNAYNPTYAALKENNEWVKPQ